MYEPYSNNQYDDFSYYRTEAEEKVEIVECYP